MLKPVYKIFFPFLVVLALLTSCLRNEELDTNFSRLRLTYYEQFTSEGRELVFYLATVEDYPCSNFLIQSHVRRHFDRFDIECKGVYIPNYCATAMGPATSELNLGLLSQIPARFTIWVKQEAHVFELSIDEHRLDFIRREKFNNLLIVEHQQLNRIPEHTVWGFMKTSNADLKEKAKALEQQFLNAGAELRLLSPGDYYHFRVEHAVPVWDHAFTYHPFCLKYDGGLNDLSILASELEGEVRITLHNTKGESYSK